MMWRKEVKRILPHRTNIRNSIKRQSFITTKIKTNDILHVKQTIEK